MNTPPAPDAALGPQAMPVTPATLPLQPSAPRDDPAAAGPVVQTPDADPRGRVRLLLRRLHAWREDVRRRPRRHKIYKATVGVIGGSIVIGGLVLVPLPGPGWVIVFVGLAILASEFERADRVQRFARSKVRAWTAWVNRQSLVIRLAVGLATFVFVAAVVYGLAVLSGVPSWVPGWMVPPLPGLD